MFLSNLKTRQELAWKPKALREALEFIKGYDLLTMDLGVYPIKDDLIFVQNLAIDTKNPEELKYESHFNYADVQILLDGEEQIGYLDFEDTFKVIEAYEDRDLYFYDIQPERETFIQMHKGDYAVLMPTDVHKPGIQVGDSSKIIRKAVVKIHVSLFK